jgi:hypothetical protein
MWVQSLRRISTKVVQSPFALMGALCNVLLQCTTEFLGVDALVCKVMGVTWRVNATIFGCLLEYLEFSYCGGGLVSVISSIEAAERGQVSWHWA